MPTRTTTSLCALAAVLVFVLFPTLATAQGSDTIYDEAGVLSDSQEQRVQEEFDAAQQDSGQPLYAFLVHDTGVDDEAAQQEVLIREAEDANVPQGAGVVVVAPNDGWGQTYNFPQEAYNTMVPGFQQGDFAAGLIAGAEEIQGEPVAPQSDPDPGAGGLPGSGLLLVLVAVVGAVLFFRNRRSAKRRIEDERRSAEGEFAELTTQLDEFDEKERLVSGYLEAQRPLLDQRTEEWVEAKISDAKTAGFAQEFNEAASRLTSDPASARASMERGRDLLEGSLQNLDEAEMTIDDYRAADEILDGKLRAAAEEIRADLSPGSCGVRGPIVEPGESCRLSRPLRFIRAEAQTEARVSIRRPRRCEKRLQERKIQTSMFAEAPA